MREILLRNIRNKIKTRYSKHKQSFNHEKRKNDTQLSNELWKIEASTRKLVLVWKTWGQYQTYHVNIKWCLICLNEKLQIAIHRGTNMVNNRTKIISKCRVRNKYAWANYDDMNWNMGFKIRFLEFFFFFFFFFVII